MPCHIIHLFSKPTSSTPSHALLTLSAARELDSDALVDVLGQVQDSLALRLFRARATCASRTAGSAIATARRVLATSSTASRSTASACAAWLAS